ncbi:MAG: aminoacyl-histidine dipeptidase [Eubacterium sp.]|nr:aminoacyl-histidine dipeptidase [Eubacterium sp.]
MSILEGKQPEKVFHYFEEICSIPHGSENVKQISDYLVDFARQRGLKYRQDEKLNVIIWKEASAGYEDSAPVILQGHMDMVAVKDPDVDKDMEKEGLDLAIDGDMLYARGTSLGGDDGIAVAYTLAVLDDDTIPHPPIEAVITTDEEIGMLGADYLDTSDLKSRILLNIDSEDEGIFTVSCAGGATAICSIPVEREEIRAEKLILRLSGLAGGHSGEEIGRGGLNANTALGRILYTLSDSMNIRLVDVRGGEKDNAIPISSEAVIALPGGQADRAMDLMEDVFAVLKEEYGSLEPDMELDMGVTGEEEVVCFTAAASRAVVSALMVLPNGVIRMNPDMKDMVQTSLNLGILRTSQDQVSITYSVRSSSETEKENLIEKIDAVIQLVGGNIKLTGSYPGWEYRPESHLRDTMVEAYRLLYGEDPVVEGIHAGLECGLFAAKMPGLDAISFGPQMQNIHTTGERLSIESTRRTWDLLLKTLEMLK